jgi:hypothetical protein
MTEIDYTEAVGKGMARLEEFKPGCLDRIDLHTLDIAESERCAAAQAIGDGDFGVAMELLGLHADFRLAAEYGFCVDSPEIRRLIDQGAFNSVRQAYAPLTAAWKTALEARLAA